MLKQITNKLQQLPSFIMLATLLIFSPLIASGKDAYALLTIEIIGIILLGYCLWTRNYTKYFSKLTWLALLIGIAIPLVYLIPIPLSLWQELPGRSFYLPVMNWLLTNDLEPQWLSLSIVPQKTLLSVIAILPLIAVFLATSSQPKKNTLWLVYIFLFNAGLQAALGIIQYTSRNENFFFFDSNHQAGNAVGTYLNRDHMVALLYIALPLTIGLLASNIGRKSPNHDQIRSLNTHVITIITLSTLVLLLIIAAIFTRSRAGIFLMILAIIFSSIAFARHIGGTRSSSITATIATLSIGIASSIGLVPVLNRFIALDPLEDGRWKIFDTTIEAIKFFFPIGSGPGTFQEVYRNFQSEDHFGFTNHAHNDYLELLLETGLLGGIWGIVSFLILTLGWYQIRHLQWGKIHFIKTSAGISILLMLLHGLVDFNFHTPANSIAFMFLVSLFIRYENITPQ